MITAIEDAASDSATAKIVLIAGKVKLADRPGHHDYDAGCELLAALLAQSPRVRAVVVRDGWPADDAVLDDARSVVFYNSGGNKQPILASRERVSRMQALADRGVGIAMIHQAICFPLDVAAPITAWMGGVHLYGESGRGHWRSRHHDLPEHPVTQGVAPWTIRDGWLNGIRFASGMDGITPLVWSGRRHRGSSAGGSADVVSWAYERPNGGRSFCYTGVDAHSAWSIAGVRQLIVNGILWSAGLPIPTGGAPIAITDDELSRYLTPRRPRGAIEMALHGLRRFARLSS